LKRILPIVLFLVFSVFHSEAQENRLPLQNGAPKAILYPNPATSYITFDLQKGFQKGMTITVFNFLGKKMSESQNVNEKTNVVLTDFNRGVYIYHVTDPAGKVVDTGKFQVSR
jgi:hypothetical protein